MPRNVDHVSLAISAALDDARTAQRLSQRELGRRMGSAPCGVSALLDGRSARTTTYAKALDALGYRLTVTLTPKTP